MLVYTVVKVHVPSGAISHKKCLEPAPFAQLILIDKYHPHLLYLSTRVHHVNVVGNKLYGLE